MLSAVDEPIDSSQRMVGESAFASILRAKLEEALQEEREDAGRWLDGSFVGSERFYDEKLEPRRMVVVVDDAESARTALGWAMHNVIRGGDIITLLHVHPSSARGRASDFTPVQLQSSEGSRRLHRLKGFQLALSFKDLCDLNPEAKVEILVVEGDQGPTIVSMAKKLRATALILGQHKRGLLGRILGKKDTPEYCIQNSDCLVLAVKQRSRKIRFNGYTKTASQVKIMRYL
ncbi:hypothetical protein GOP47_0024511 [Adiantum capillus-veneris]|uniref:UspA domain-containing protein n=1 Tax=Adiantum capillus-veneris TaxID=13818 RepID=A0A9D4U4L5_ADICA|nr:hypothetical protein GOP47_0024511 [Adiantum capillus-veneris]